MNGELMQFHFESSEIRTIVDSENDLWFIAQDVCDILGLANVSAACAGLDDDEKGIRKVDTLRGEQEMLIISESGFYSVVSRSNKPQARPFQKWVTREVLPAIRKTGSYTLPQSTSLTLAPPAPPRVDPESIKRDVKAFKSIGKDLGFQGNNLIFSICNAIKRQHAVDLLDILGAKHLISDNQESRHYSVTEIGARVGLSAVKLNKLLCDQGFQEANRDAKKNITYSPTDKGKPFSVLVDTNKAHHSGLPMQTLRWYATILEQVQILQAV